MTNPKINSFRDLVAWQVGHRLVLLIYKVTRSFPRDEIFGITNQMRRAVVSITSNICEGFSRHSYKEKIQFYYIALGSLSELQNQVQISKDLGYINELVYCELSQICEELSKIINGLIKGGKLFS